MQLDDPIFAEAAAEVDSDILILNAPFMPIGQMMLDEHVRMVVDQHSTARKKLVVILVTSGGLPDVAYRIAMLLRDRYEHIAICIPGWCKSAGTLLAIAGNELIMGRRGEMGPLDVQIAKRDELGGDRDSGLVINEALARLRDESFDLFNSFMLKQIAQSANLVTLRTAADISAQLTIGLMAPIFEKIDPMRMGADARAMSIGEEYALRLNRGGKNLRGEKGLNMLLNGYPSHSFVIDINEARELFTRVKPLEGKLAEAVAALGDMALKPKGDVPIIEFLQESSRGKASEEEGAGEELLGEPVGGNDEPAANDAGRDNDALPEQAGPSGQE